MKYTYEINEDGSITRRSDLGEVACIPNDPANADYQAYLNPDKMEHLTEIVPDEPAVKSK